MALRPSFPFLQEVFPLKPVPFCTLFAGLGIINKFATSLLFSYLTLVLPYPPFFLLPQSFWQILQELFSLSCSIKLQWLPGHSFLPGNDASDELARRGTLLVASAISCSLPPLISRIHSPLFSDWRHTVSSNFFDTQVSSISTEKLVLLRHTCCVLSRLRCNGHSLLLSSYLYSIGRNENPSCSACGHRPTTPLISFCTVQLWTFCAACSLAIFCLSTTSDSSPEEFPGFLDPMVFRHALITSKGSDNSNSKIEITDALLRNKGS